MKPQLIFKATGQVSILSLGGVTLPKPIILNPGDELQTCFGLSYRGHLLHAKRLTMDAGGNVRLELSAENAMKARLKTQRDAIRSRILGNPEWLKRMPVDDNREVVQVAKRVCLLDPETATVEDMLAAGDSIVPITYHCHGCGEWVPEVVEVGDEPDYDSNTAFLCQSCAIEAVRQFKD